jgi:hypothetical protein
MTNAEMLEFFNLLDNYIDSKIGYELAYREEDSEGYRGTYADSKQVDRDKEKVIQYITNR